jgi:hypothetical protein
MPDDIVDADDPWIVPLHGIEAPAAILPIRTLPVEDPVTTAHLYDDDELPTIEFRPRLRRSA